MNTHGIISVCPHGCGAYARHFTVRDVIMWRRKHRCTDITLVDSYKPRHLAAVA